MVSYLFQGEAKNMFYVSLLFLSHHSILFQKETASLPFFLCTQVEEERKMDACAKMSPIQGKRCSRIK